MLEDPFDWTASLVKDATWLNRKILQIDDTILSAEQLLRMMVNREGAHSDRDDMTQLSISAPVKISLPDAGDEAYSRANTLRFSRLSYIQIFAYLVGIYLVNMMKASEPVSQSWCTLGRRSLSSEVRWYYACLSRISEQTTRWHAAIGLNGEARSLPGSFVRQAPH